ncbi:MAG: YcxB family protein [Oscillospiraceae bacterium]|jgi:uncharacterized membrane protein|nr:YcxB family protein [Oscillospiraceae bacterium]
MSEQLLNKAEISIDPTDKEYKDAWLLAERAGGWLRPLPLVVFIAAALLFAGLCSLDWFRHNYSSVFLPLLLCFCCPVLLMVFFFVVPKKIETQASRDYLTYKTLMAKATIKLNADTVVTSTENLTFNDSYALMAGCIETPQLFVLIKDRERILIIPKRCLPTENADNIVKFLRHVFARKRRVMKNWAF